MGWLMAMFRKWCIAITMIFSPAAVCLCADNPEVTFDHLSATLFKKDGPQKEHVEFTVTNVTTTAITITDIKVSCGCLSFDPSQLGSLKPGESRMLVVFANLENIQSETNKTVLMAYTVGDHQGLVALKVKIVPSTTISCDPAALAWVHGDTTEKVCTVVSSKKLKAITIIQQPDVYFDTTTVKISETTFSIHFKPRENIPNDKPLHWCQATIAGVLEVGDSPVDGKEIMLVIKR